MADGILCGALASICSRDIFLLCRDYWYLSGIDHLPPDISRAIIAANKDVTYVCDDKGKFCAYIRALLDDGFATNISEPEDAYPGEIIYKN